MLTQSMNMNEFISFLRSNPIDASENQPGMFMYNNLQGKLVIWSDCIFEDWRYEHGK